MRRFFKTSTSLLISLGMVLPTSTIPLFAEESSTGNPEEVPTENAPSPETTAGSGKEGETTTPTDTTPTKEVEPENQSDPLSEQPADIVEGTPGATVSKDEQSPSGYTVDFVYDGTSSEKEITKVEVSGPFNYTDAYNEGVETPKNADPYHYENGMYASNNHGDDSSLWAFTAELTDDDQDKIYEVKFPITSGTFGYNYILTYADGTTAKIADPANLPNAEGKINEAGNHNSGDTNSSVVKGHWDPVKQSKSPNMDYVLPVGDSSKEGKLEYIEYTNIAGDKTHLGIYTPAGYDANRETPYKTIYISHGAGGDEQDWYHMGSIDDIMDNFVAEGKAEAAIIVTMDNSALLWDATKTLPNIVDTIIPLVESKYNVSTKVEDRAMLGLSAGAMTTTKMFIEYPTTFGYFGMFSGSSLPDEGLEFKDDYAKPIVMVTTGTTDFASSRRTGQESAFSSERLDAWLKENVPDTYATEDIYVKGSHDWFEWPQSFATFLKDIAWKSADGTTRPTEQATAGATVVDNTLTLAYDDVDERNAVSVTVAGNFQWYDPEEADQYVAMGENAGIHQYRAEEYEEGMYNASGLHGQEIYELTQTVGEHFELTLTVPGNLYFYDYTVTYADGTSVTIKDPANLPKANPETGSDSGHSIVYVGSSDNCTPGQEYIYARTDNKVGTREYVPYKAIDGTTQYIEVYLPYGYDENETYKTLYISHGGGGNEAEWMEIGAAGNIMDNLVVDGKVEPTVVVAMNNSYFGWDYEKVLPNIVDYIIPYMEKNYAVSKDPDDRAFCGLSMGSMTTNQMAKSYPNEFGYFGSFSGGSTDLDKTHYDVEALNDSVLYLTAGCIDMAYNNDRGISSLDYLAMYDELGVNYTFDLLLGAHDWGVWRESLTKFASEYLWKVEAPTMIEGMNAEWTKESTSGLSFKSDAKLKNFQAVLVDGKEVEAKNYVLDDESTLITLTADYLNTLAEGKHTLGIKSKNGVAETEFTIKAVEKEDVKPTTPTDKEDKKPNKDKDKNNAANTGDQSNMMLWSGMLVVAMGALVLVVIKKKKLTK